MTGDWRFQNVPPTSLIRMRKILVRFYDFMGLQLVSVNKKRGKEEGERMGMP